MNFVTKKSLPRRTMLKGLGAGVALPLLDAMIPALSAQTKAPRPALALSMSRMASSFPSGSPSRQARAFELSPNLQPLAKVRDHVNVFTNLSHLEADTKGDGSGDHNRAAAAWLTGVHAYDRTRPGAEIRLATSVDQIAAKNLGRDTQMPSVEVTTDAPSQGACDSGDCFYVNTVSWRNETAPNAPELYPRVVFERLFGDGGSAAQRRARMRRLWQHSRFGARRDQPAHRAPGPGRQLEAGRIPGFDSRCRTAHTGSRSLISRNPWNCQTGQSVFRPASKNIAT